MPRGLGFGSLFAKLCQAKPRSSVHSALASESGRRRRTRAWPKVGWSAEVRVEVGEGDTRGLRLQLVTV